VVIGLIVGVCLSRRRRPEPPLDPESLLQAAIELHRIGRRLDVDWTKYELRRDADRLEHRIVELTDEHDEP
jgi:hypothetical protein